MTAVISSHREELSLLTRKHVFCFKEARPFMSEQAEVGNVPFLEQGYEVELLLFLPKLRVFSLLDWGGGDSNVPKWFRSPKLHLHYKIGVWLPCSCTRSRASPSINSKVAVVGWLAAVEAWLSHAEYKSTCNQRVWNASAAATHAAVATSASSIYTRASSMRASGSMCTWAGESHPSLECRCGWCWNSVRQTPKCWVTFENGPEAPKSFKNFRKICL